MDKATAIIILALAVQSYGIDPHLSSVEYIEYEYSMQRKMLEDGERLFQGLQDNLTQNETVVDNYLEYLKWAEFEATKSAFPTARPIEDVLDQIKASKVYKVLKKFPKGGLLHLHQNHILPKRKMLEIIFNSSLYDVLCVNVENSSKKWNLGFFLTPPNGWAKVKENPIVYSLENLLLHLTLINTLPADARANPTDSSLRWKYMGPMFSRAATHVVLYKNYTRMHMQALFQHCLEENVQYLEARSTGYGMYVLDDSVAGGQRNIDDKDGNLWFQTMIEEVNTFKQAHPEFIGYKEIYQGKRYETPEQVRQSLESALRLRAKYPEMMTGFDLVSEEDQGYSLLFFIDEFAKLIAENRSVPFYFHTSETNWPSDLMTSLHPLDPVSTLDNVYEAVILNSRRVGHGLGFIKHPYLLQILKERHICVELNPVSNMLLGYVTDQRHHPGQTYLRYGIPVVLAADDPGSMGYDEVTVDWYEAFMAWGLRLTDMRTLAINSLNYSTMSVQEKSLAMTKYQNAWDLFILETAHEACSKTWFYPTVNPEIHSIFPKAGLVSSNTTVRVFGRNLHAAICETIICRFGMKESYGRYVYNYMIVCDAPQWVGVPARVDFSISLNSGKDFIVMNNLTYLYLNEFGNSQSPGLVG